MVFFLQTTLEPARSPLRNKRTVAAGAQLQRVELKESTQPSKPQRKRRLQWGVQGQTVVETHGKRHPAGPSSVDWFLLLKTYGKYIGAIAFVDDYNAWVMGPSAEANKEGSQAIIGRALDRRGGAESRSKGDKIVMIHTTRRPDRISTRPFSIKGEAIAPKEPAKILGVIMDSGLRYA